MLWPSIHHTLSYIQTFTDAVPSGQQAFPFPFSAVELTHPSKPRLNVQQHLRNILEPPHSTPCLQPGPSWVPSSTPALITESWEFWGLGLPPPPPGSSLKASSRASFFLGLQNQPEPGHKTEKRSTLIPTLMMGKVRLREVDHLPEVTQLVSVQSWPETQACLTPKLVSPALG